MAMTFGLSTDIVPVSITPGHGKRKESDDEEECKDDGTVERKEGDGTGRRIPTMKNGKGKRQRGHEVRQTKKNNNHVGRTGE